MTSAYAMDQSDYLYPGKDGGGKAVKGQKKITYMYFKNSLF